MNKILLILLISAIGLSGFSQITEIDSLKEAVEAHEGKLNALDERVLVNEADLGKLNKIKVTGYIQAQWEYYGKDLITGNDPSNTFYIRRARIKFTYEATDGVKFVLQPDFSTGNLSLKDAYAVVNLPKLKNWAIWAGQFNRPDYEVEYSSSQREVLERSRMIRTIYPGEREVGVKIEYNGTTVPLKFQLMAMNGNFMGSQQKDADSKKDLMGRLVYSVRLPSSRIGVDFGVNGYFGGTRVKTNQYLSSLTGELDSLIIGDYLNRKWYGAEMQIYADFLGGLALKAEYISGRNASASSIVPTATMAAKKADPNKIRDFAGYYLYLIKNIGSRNQLVARYDYYDPNTRLSGDNAKKEIWYKTLTLAWQYYLNDNIRISLNYEMPSNEINSAYPTNLKDNVLGVRVQAKF